MEEWITQFVQAMYNSDELRVKVGVYQGSVLSPVLFIIVCEALSRELCTGAP